MVLEGLMAWMEAQLLPCVTVSSSTSQRSRRRRLLTSTDCTLMSDPDSTDTLGQSQSVSASDVSLSNHPNVSADTRQLVDILIKVRLCIGTLYTANFDY